MTPRVQALSLLVLVSTFATVLPHPLHMIPLGAMAVFAGATFHNLGWAVAVSLLARLAKDVTIEWGGRTGPALDNNLLILLVSTYACLALSAGLGSLVRGRGPTRVAGLAAAGLGGWAVFFLVTNFVFWAMYSQDRSLAGVLTTYAAGIPFGLRQLLADGVYLTLLFGTWVTLECFVPGIARDEHREPVRGHSLETAGN